MIQKLKLDKYITRPENQIELINTESLKFGILELNFHEPVLITEGPIDSFFLPNSLSPTGIKRMPLLNYLPYPYFIYDNDKIGRDYAEEAVKQGEKVFMWKKFLNQYSLPQKGIKDINDVFKHQKINKKELFHFFTDDPLDIWDI